MSWIMTIAAGVALGYFLVQFITKNARIGEETEAAETAADTETVRAESTEEQQEAEEETTAAQPISEEPENAETQQDEEQDEVSGDLTSLMNFSVDPNSPPPDGFGMRISLFSFHNDLDPDALEEEIKLNKTLTAIAGERRESVFENDDTPDFDVLDQGTGFDTVV